MTSVEAVVEGEGALHLRVHGRAEAELDFRVGRLLE